jgi:hypothetical protein
MLISSIVISILILLGPFATFHAVAVNAPMLVSPIDNITVRSTNYDGALAVPPLAIPTFQWQAVSGANSYALEISQDINFVTKLTFTTPLTTYTPTNVGNFTDGHWYWRVKVNVAGAGYSETWGFWREWASIDNFPVLTSPADSATLEFFDPPVFSWDPVIGAAKYRLQISGNYDFSTISYTKDTIPTTHQPLTKLINGIYFWRVIPLDPSNRLGTPSEIRSFTMGYNQVPNQIEPADNTFPIFTPTFRWQAVRGAQQYLLEYSTSSTFGPGTISITTNNTTYTPQSTLPNDINYYWHVRAKSGNSLSDWSSTWYFQKRWYLVPTLLTPTNNYSYVRFPFFSWTPVPGAARYRIQIDKDPDFVNVYLDQYTSVPYFTPRNWFNTAIPVYWRVIPYDGSNNAGQKSAEWSFQNSSANTTPVQIYPLFYYTPDSLLNPHEDHTAPFPVFMWSRLTDLTTGANSGVKYQVEVCSDGLCNSPVWTEQTQNLYATPTTANPFAPIVGVDYWWRVRGLDTLGNPVGGGWSQIWRARFDPALGLMPVSGAPQILRPVDAAEIVDQTPLFEWQRVTGADYYQVEIYNNPGLSGPPVVSDQVPYPVFSPKSSLAQRNLIPIDPTKLAFGTYYWHVRAHTPSGLGPWSSAQRFQIAAQSEWQASRALGNTALPYQIAADPIDSVDPNFEMTTLFVTQDSNNWYFGFQAFTQPTNMVYALLLDLDHSDNSGATSLPAPFNTVTTIPAHQPEYVILINQEAGLFTASGVSIYTWTGSSWSLPAPLLSPGGIMYNLGSNYVELALQNTAIGYNTTGGSYAVSLISLTTAGGSPLDSIPSDPAVPGGGPISRFASVSQRMNLHKPPNNLGGDPTSFPFVPPFFWDYPTGSNGTDPWSGAKIEYHFDPGFTNPIGQFTLNLSSIHPYYYSPPSFSWLTDLSGNNTYYWRVQPRYSGGQFGVWSQGWRFEMRNFVPQNLSESVTFATPTFTWDRVEGAESYDLQVSLNLAFTNLATSITTRQNTFTPTGTYDSNRTYYWRVRAIRNGVPAQNYWSDIKPFDLILPVPSGLTPHDPDPQHAVRSAPTFCWTPLIASPPGQPQVPVIAAYQYRLQVSRTDPTFSTKTEYTTEQSCLTPPEGYADGTYYWRVAMLDGQGKISSYSNTAVITKQYPMTTLVSPLNATVPSTPTFIWVPVSGAEAYKFEVSINSNFSPLFDSATTNQTTYTPTKIYASNQIFYWRVAIIDADGKVGPFTGGTILIGPYTNRVFLPVVAR